MRAGIVVVWLVSCGPSPTVIVANTDVYSIALDATNVYWTASDGVYAAPKSGNRVTPSKLAPLATARNGLTAGIAVDDSFVGIVRNFV